MNARIYEDLHAPFVQGLTADGDWAGLVRYWLAHQNEAALAAALTVVKGQGSCGGNRSRLLADFLEKVREEPLNPGRKLSNELVSGSTPAERVALALLVIFPRATMCELAIHAPVEVRDELLKVGLKAAQQAGLLAAQSLDHALTAFFWNLKARGLTELHRLSEARANYQVALALYQDLSRQRPQVYTAQVALVLNNLGNVASDLGDKEAASAYLQEALAIRRGLAQHCPEVHGPDVAQTLRNLGTVQFDQNDLENALATFEVALAYYRELVRIQPHLHRSHVAGTLNNLANVRLALNDLESARDHYVTALDEYRELNRLQPEIYGPDVAMTLHNLGSVLRVLNELEGAQASCQEALDGYFELAKHRPEHHWPDVALALNTLGNVQRDLNDLEKARASFQQTLAIRRRLAELHPERYRPDLALTLINLGNVLSDLNELALARASYQEALVILRELTQQRPDVYWPVLATNLNNLGVLLSNLNDFEAAQSCYQEALAGYFKLVQQRPEVYAKDVAMTLNNLGIVQHAINNLHEACSSYSEALACFRELARLRPHIFRHYVALVLNNLGNAKRDLNGLEAANACYQEAVELYQEDAAIRPTAHLIGRQRCWNNLALLRLRESSELGWPDHQLARQAYQQAMQCAESYRFQFLQPMQRQRVQSEALHVYEGLLQTDVDLWLLHQTPDALPEAVEVAEASRARNLMELLADEALEPPRTPPATAEQFKQLRRRLRQTERRCHNEELRIENEPEVVTRRPLVEDLRHEFERVEQEYLSCLRRIQLEYAPEFDPDCPVPPVNFEQARTLLPTDVPTAIVQYCLTSERCLALLITRDNVRAIALPEMNDREAWELAATWYRNYFGRRDPQASDDLGQGDTALGWGNAQQALVNRIAERLVQPVLTELAGRGIKRLVLVPNRALHVFPLHACRLHDGRYLGEAYEVCYTPSLSILHRCVSRKRKKCGQLFLVENPTVDPDLHFAELEGWSLRRRCVDHRMLYGGEATREQILEQSGDCHLFYYTGHSQFDPVDPLGSALVLGDDRKREQWLMLRDIFTGLQLRENLLTVISGCESGMVKPDRVDEYVSLPSGFLYAGAVCVVSTMWAVSDVSSALLMDRFLQDWYGGQPVAAALREAQRWLRDEITSGFDLRDRVLPALLAGIDDEHLKQQCLGRAEVYAKHYPDSPPFASPFHWAPYVATGLGYSLPHEPAAAGDADALAKGSAH